MKIYKYVVKGTKLWLLNKPYSKWLVVDINNGKALFQTNYPTWVVNAIHAYNTGTLK